jgi:hypothetical protein
MRIFLKATSAVFALVFLLSCNLCTVECAFASGEHHHEAEEKEGHSDSDEHDAGSPCCSSLVATQNPTNFPTSFGPVKNLIGNSLIFERLLPQADVRFERKFEFPSGASPPRLFLLSYTNHAPPVSL